MDSKGVLWIGTDEKLIAFKNDSVISTLTQDEGLLSNDINLWPQVMTELFLLAQTMGLTGIFLKAKEFFPILKETDFPGLKQNQMQFIKAPAGDLWFGTANGATQLSPEKLQTEELEPLTHIMEMQVNNDTCEMIPGMKLKYNERSILFDYYSICLTNPDVVRYKVKLEGADQDWQTGH